MASSPGGKQPRTPCRQNGSAVRDFRIKAGLTRGELAERTGLSYTIVANVENEFRTVSIEVLHRFASVLMVDVRSLLREPPPIVRYRSRHHHHDDGIEDMVEDVA